MEMRELGQSGLAVSVLSLGTVKFGRNTQVKNASADGFPLPSDQEIRELLEICVDKGINLLDTAPAYGVSEERLGSLIGNLRDKFVISTKVGEEFDGESSEYDFSSEYIQKSVERSLKRLGTDRLDSVLLHCHRKDLSIMKDTDAIETLQRLKEKGDILAFGSSTHTVEGGIFAVENTDLAMVPFNPGYKEHLPVIEKAKELGKGILIKRGLNAGFLDDQKPEDSLKECIRASVEQPGVTSLVMGTINPKHLVGNIDLLTALT